MRWFRNGSLLLVCLGLVLSSSFAAKKDEAGTDKPKKEKNRSEKKDRGDKKKDKNKDQPEEDGALNLPIVEGHDSKGLRIPYYDAEGKLQMQFTIGLATKVADNRVRMKETVVETYKEDATPDLTVDLPTSELDLKTRVVTSKVQTTIKREDFLLKGDTVAFDTVNRQAKLTGNVHMTIYDLEAEAGAKPAANP